MKTWLFGRHSYGDKILVTHFKNTFTECDHLGEKVDLSKITPEEENLIIILNSSLLSVDQDRVLAYINKDKTKPLMVLKKYKNFGTVFFKPNFEVERISTNKSYTFSGILYLPKKYFDSLPKGKKTIAEIFRSVPYEDWNFYIIDPKRR